MGPGAGRRRSGSLKEAEVLSSSATGEGAHLGVMWAPQQGVGHQSPGTAGARGGSAHKHSQPLCHTGALALAQAESTCLSLPRSH